MLSNLSNQNHENKKAVLEEMKILKQNKLNLIDKTSKIFYQLPGVNEMMNFHLSNNFDSLTINPINGHYNAIPKNYTLSKELSQLRADFFSVLIQDKLFFGKKTTSTIDTLFKNNRDNKLSWWETPDSMYFKVLIAMTEEL